MVTHSTVEGNPGNPARRVRNNELQPANCQPPRPRPAQHIARCPDSQTHYRTFNSEADFKTITETTRMLKSSGFYWGPMTVEEAHQTLKKEPLGTFLIRDSRQNNYFFTLSYCEQSGPISIRIKFQGSRFSLVGSKESFDSLFKLLEYYVTSPKSKISRPYRKVQVQSLQELCRRRIIETCGGEGIEQIPVNPILKDFLHSFPFRL
ncbi:suppressor of cytokine signaling 1a [Chanos chanos]|uniref:Suppressor of cytokine signaling 1 n=1 Tax=Chanos chanos TaxID=29144 RepID=A0A6J2WQ82_CHACN|nr:suppressor of cytokine signaling 1 [Chanos chanos]